MFVQSLHWTQEPALPIHVLKLHCYQKLTNLDPSTGIPHLPTADDHESADHTHNSELQDEDNGSVPGRRKHRSREIANKMLLWAESTAVAKTPLSSFNFKTMCRCSHLHVDQQKPTERKRFFRKLHIFDSH